MQHEEDNHNQRLPHPIPHHLEGQVYKIPAYDFLNLSQEIFLFHLLFPDFLEILLQHNLLLLAHVCSE